MEYDYSKLGLTNEELFSEYSHSDLESEKITAPRYSYWHSVFRVFFRKKINIVILSLLAFIIAFAYIYPAVTDFDPYKNLLDPALVPILSISWAPTAPARPPLTPSGTARRYPSLWRSSAPLSI